MITQAPCNCSLFGGYTSEVARAGAGEPCSRLHHWRGLRCSLGPGDLHRARPLQVPGPQGHAAQLLVGVRDSPDWGSAGQDPHISPWALAF